jgi:CubicO group peptidase (beta-lactamase class C family)
MQPKTQDEIIAIIAKNPPKTEPGEKAEYSNSGFVVLGYIVEKVTSKPYREALKERITSKIGLKDTYLGTGSTDVGKNESYSYNFLGDWKQEAETHPSIPGGAGAIISTPNDLVRFIQALFDDKVVSKQSLDSMMQNKFGMDTLQLAGKTFYGHTGAIDNFGAWLAYLPEEKLTVAYTANARVYPVSNIVNGIFDIYYNKPFEIPGFETINVSPEVLDKYVGVYSSPQVPFKLSITREGSTLLAQPTGQATFLLEATAQDKFKIEARGIILEFDAAKNQMTFKQRDREIVLTKGN